MSTTPAHRVPSDPSSGASARTSKGLAASCARSASSPPPPPSVPDPADPPPRTLRADDPSELLAEARVTLGCVPRDCLVMIGHSGRRLSPLATRIALRDVGDGPGGVDVPRHLALLDRAGCDGAFVLVLAGDGWESVEESRTDDARRIALEVVRAAALRGPDGFDVPEAWVVSGGCAESFALTPEDDGAFALRVLEWPGPLTHPRDTLVGVQEIHAGRRVPEDDPAAEREMRMIGDALRDVASGEGVPGSRPGAFETSARWHALLGALRRARIPGAVAGEVPGTGEAPGSGGDDLSMSHCERLAGMRDLLAAPDAALSLLHVLSGLEEEGEDGGIEGLVRFVARLAADPSLRPASRICAGGEWFEALLAMRMACEGTGSAPMVGASAGAWTALGTALAVLSWWNHRFATADDLAQEIEMRGEDEVLALFLLQIARARVRPAWRPATA
ncbi:hypothetical protein I8D64_00385 [Brachybacterium sp. MASK1Z-5]|uniref:DUF4192 domain-containing protein n=1 Tax=Brachybacterium halotolerans TaxID=2795215 RepID=A0ABS1B5F2_9MICO|nr:hypothetical protein [Brachybacterium halotolerans]MBK0329863.1 hypothetical protein [Brachybacterium halotolerans]